MELSTWLGKDKIDVDKGYWRYTANSSTIIECLNSNACLGGYEPNNKYPVQWAKGYKGILWTKWDIINGTKYQPLSGFYCSKWPAPFLNAIKFTAVVTAAFLFVLLLIYVNLRKKEG